jgi:hypothetical protein
MKIAIDINGVVRDTLGKAEQVYKKFFIDDYVSEEGEESFEYSLNLPISSTTLSNHFAFPTEESFYDFFYVDFPMEIFGHAPSVSGNTFNNLDEIYKSLRDSHEVYIISEEMERSKPATLFFLAKYGCLVENIKFYSKLTQESLWDNFDIILTANPDLINNAKKDTQIVKFNKLYNSDVNSKLSIDTLEEFVPSIKNFIENANV